MQIRIYFDHRVLILTNDTTSDEPEHGEGDLSAALKEKIDQLRSGKIESATMQGNPQHLLENVRAYFVTVQAAGGLVVNNLHEALLIYRREKWDLPKGKLDKGEDLKTCAVREVEEETGLKEISLKHKITVTFHTYEHKGKNVLKESHWYLMQTTYQGELQPQLDEDIVECRWAAFETLDSYRTNIHASVNDVLDYAKPYLV